MFTFFIFFHTTSFFSFFFFNDTATTEIYTLSLHDALPICGGVRIDAEGEKMKRNFLRMMGLTATLALAGIAGATTGHPDRKSTRLNSSHLVISYAVFCLKKKKK